jgi:HNH endonuclease
VLQVHHVIARSVQPELALNLDNLVSLCPKCHDRITQSHRKARTANSDRHIDFVIRDGTGRIIERQWRNGKGKVNVSRDLL